MTTHQAAPLASTEVTRVADAFRPATLANFAQRPSGAHLFRVQHDDASTRYALDERSHAGRRTMT